MPGMGGGGGNASLSNAIVSAFHSALLHQWLIVMLVFALIAVAWNLMRVAQLQKQAREGQLVFGEQVPSPREPLARHVLRIAFGLIWLLDGLLQGQAGMPLNMANQVVEPTAKISSGWVDHLVSAGVTVWNNHPVTAATAAFWIQIGIAVWLLCASRGIWSRAGGLVSAGWGVAVWIFGESFGGLFAPGYTWLFGAPGAVLIYAIAGVLIALPERIWNERKLAIRAMRIFGLYLVIMGIVQAWPGRGFWQGAGSSHTSAGTLTGMVQSMAQTPQPHLFSSLVNSFASFDASHGFAVNLFVVIALVGVGLGFVTVSVHENKLTSAFGWLPFPLVLGFFAVLCLADWIFVQDLGFFGGLGTDPNSMVPFIVFAAGLTLWAARAAVTTEDLPVLHQARPRPSFAALSSYIRLQPLQSLRSFAAGGALFVTLFGILPMGLASLNPMADPIISQAVDGTPAAEVRTAPGIALLDQWNRPVSLAQFRGKTVVLTFLDPVCISDCPIIGQELRRVDALLGSQAASTVFIAVDANPLFRSSAYTTAYSSQEGLSGYANWRYLSGPLPALERTWANYGVTVSYYGPGSMIAHNDIMYVIDPSGKIRYVINSDPGSATPVTESSFESTLIATINAVRS